MHGCGGVGLSAVQIAAAAGARVIAVDVAPGALALARELGAEHTVDGGADVPAAVVELTGGGAHVSLDALGAAGHLHELDPQPPPARPARAGGAAAAGAGAPRGADGAGDRPGAAGARQPRHGGARLSGAARADRRRAAGPAAADHPPARPRRGSRRARRGRPAARDRRRHVVLRTTSRASGPLERPRRDVLSAAFIGVEGREPVAVQGTEQQGCQQSAEPVLLPQAHTAVLVADGPGELDVEEPR